MPKNPSGGGRDSYPTPYPYAEVAILHALKFHQFYPVASTFRILEPGCGGKYPFVQAAHNNGIKGIFRGIDVMEGDSAFTEEPQRRYGIDFLTASPEEYTPLEVRDHGGWDIIATNPPYSVALEFVRKSLEILHPEGIAVFLLRVGFAGSIKRMPLFREHPPIAIGEFVRRFSFDGKGTDYTDYCLFFWVGSKLEQNLKHHHKGIVPTRFYWIDNSKRGEITSFGL